MFTRIIKQKRRLRVKIYFFVKYTILYILQTYWFKKRYKEYKKKGVKINKVLNKKELSCYSKWDKFFNTYAERGSAHIAKFMSNKFDENIVPENIFAADIEPSLNSKDMSLFFSSKHYYNWWFKSLNVFPYLYFSRISGKFYTSDLQYISKDEIIRGKCQITYPAILKPSVDTSAGNGVRVIQNEVELLDNLEVLENYVLQELLSQDKSIAHVYKSGINTVRVCVYRSPYTDEIHILNSTIRFGVGGNFRDNVSMGGISCRIIDESGRLNDYAIDKYCQKYYTHPDTNIPFSSCVVPEIEKLKGVSINIMKMLPGIHIASLDMCLNSEKIWKCIEVNVKGQTLRFTQHIGQSFFGDLTQEVVDYCKTHHWALIKE